MRIVYYTKPALLDEALEHIRALSSLVELHAIVEISPEGKQSSLFDMSGYEFKSTIINAQEATPKLFPESLRKYWKDCASFSFIVHTCSRSIHPRTWSVSRAAMRYISELKPDIFHLDDVSLRLAPLLFQLGRTLMVLNVHDAEQHFGEHNWRSDLARRLTFKRVSQFILHSSFSRHQFLNRYAVREDSVSMVPLGIYDIYREWLTDEMQEQPKTILFFGRISPYKGIDVYIRAAEIVSAKIPLCRFIIAGRTIRGYKLPVIPELQQGCIFEVHERYLSNNEVARFITQSSMVVCPYLDASQSGVILTAYAFNKPVIATNVGGLPEYVWEGRTGTIVPPNDANALANAIIAALSNKSTELSSSTVYDALRKNELSWTKGAETTVQIYETITRSHR